MPRPTQHQTVQLTYTNGTVAPTPEPVKVIAGDTLSLELVSPSDGKIRITIQHPEFFSHGEFKDGDPAIRVNTAASTKYDCELSVNGVVVPTQTGVPGGSIEPDAGDGG